MGFPANATATISAVRAEIRTASTDRGFIQELGIFNGAATAGTIGFGRPAAIGVTPTTPITVLPEDPGDPVGTVTTAIAWGTAPTITSINPLRRIDFPATIGAGVIWTFGGRGLAIPVSSSVIIWNLTAAAATLDIYVVVDE